MDGFLTEMVRLDGARGGLTDEEMEEARRELSGSYDLAGAASIGLFCGSS
jgi:hypothetical protein